MTTINIFQNAKESEKFADGSIIFSKGDPGDCMFGVVEGEVEIVLNDKVIDTLSSGAILGEMGLIDHSPRAASARVKGSAKLVRIDERRFNFLVQQTPFFALQVMRIITARLRKLMAAE